LCSQTFSVLFFGWAFYLCFVYFLGGVLPCFYICLVFLVSFYFISLIYTFDSLVFFVPYLLVRVLLIFSLIFSVFNLFEYFQFSSWSSCLGSSNILFNIFGSWSSSGFFNISFNILVLNLLGSFNIPFNIFGSWSFF